LRTQLFCAYVLGLYFTGARLLAQKLKNVGEIGVNFINILCAALLYESLAKSIFVLTLYVGLNFFGARIFGKCAHKMLVKLTTG
jgi:hypothetical protein